jgi:hypothetical protein
VTSTSEVIATSDVEFRASFDRKISDWATGFMRRSHRKGTPFYVYLSNTQVHIPRSGPGVCRHEQARLMADVLVQMDAFTGRDRGRAGRGRDCRGHDRGVDLRQRR